MTRDLSSVQAPSPRPLSVETLGFAISLEREGYVTLLHASYASTSLLHFLTQGLDEAVGFLNPGRTGRAVEVDVVRHVVPILLSAASKRIAASVRNRDRVEAETSYTRLVHALSKAGGAPFQNPLLVGVSSSPQAVGRYLRGFVLPLVRQFAGLERDGLLEFIAAPVLAWCGWRHSRQMSIPGDIAGDVESCVFSFLGGESAPLPCDDDFDDVWDATPRTM